MDPSRYFSSRLEDPRLREEDEGIRQWAHPAKALRRIADSLQARVMAWKYPPREEEDESRPDCEQIHKERFRRVFLEPIDADLTAAGYAEGRRWLLVHNPAVAKEVQRTVARLRKSFKKPQWWKDQNVGKLEVLLADAAYHFAQIANLLEADEPRTGENKKPVAEVGENGRAGADRRPVASSRSVTLYGRGDGPTVHGNKKDPLTHAQYDVVLALIEAGENGLAKEQFEKKSGHGGARKVMKRLAVKDADWASVLIFPGCTGVRYRIL